MQQDQATTKCPEDLCLEAYSCGGASSPCRKLVDREMGETSEETLSMACGPLWLQGLEGLVLQPERRWVGPG